MTGPQIVMICVLYTLGLGVLFRRRRWLHMSFMLVAIATDLILTLYLEVARGVIEVSANTGGEFHGNRTLLLVHVIVAVTLLATYPVLIISGFKLLRGKALNPALMHRRHRIFGVSAFTLYFLSLATAPNSVIERLANMWHLF